MTELVEIELPKLGESILSAKVVQWLKKEGDFIEENEPLVEVTTDKVNSEIPSSCKGVLKKIVALIDQDIEIGQVLAIIETVETENTEAVLSSEKNVFLPHAFISPAVMRLAEENNLCLKDLEKIKGTGDQGRITKQDTQRFIDTKQQKKAQICSKDTATTHSIKMTHLRKAIAENMKKSFYEAPHATLITEIDLTNVLKKIETHKEEFFKKHGVKLTITSCIAKAIAYGAKEYPYLNASIVQDEILLKKNVNMGIAVSVEGGVIVPVIKNCDTLDIPSLAKEIASVAYKAKHQLISLEDTQEGTITMTNFGMSGALIGVPIIRYPEVAIIGVGAVTKKVVVLKEDLIGIRSMVYLSLTFDHRIVDGIYGSNFLGFVKNYLELNSVIN
jgi:2-oxoglutarate dehydrogenase E2 component (dihydrolipoamide succinyltransferase)